MNKSKYERIMLMHDPISEQISKLSKTMVKFTTGLVIAIIIIGIFVGLSTDSLMDYFWVSGIFDFVAICLGITFYFFYAILDLKCRMLNNTFRTTMLTKEMAMTLAPDNQPQETETDTYPSDVPQSQKEQPASSAYSTPQQQNYQDDFKVPYEIAINQYGKLFCPHCGTEQNGDRYTCFKCGALFANGQPGIPHWCAKCGMPGPYNDTCPKCGSTEKILNTH